MRALYDMDQKVYVNAYDEDVVNVNELFDRAEITCMELFGGDDGDWHRHGDGHGRMRDGTGNGGGGSDMWLVGGDSFARRSLDVRISRRTTQASGPVR